MIIVQQKCKFCTLNIIFIKNKMSTCLKQVDSTLLATLPQNYILKTKFTSSKLTYFALT